MPRSILPRKRLGRGPSAEARSIGAYGIDEGWASLGSVGRGVGPTSAVNAGNAQSIAAIYQAVRIYVDAIAPLDFYIAERHPNGGFSQARYHPNYDLIHSRPNRTTTSYTFRATILGHALTRRGGFAEIERDDKARPRWLHLLDPRNVKPYVEDDGSLWYRLNREGENLPARDVLHLKPPGFNGIEGYSPIEMGRDTFGLMKSRDVYEWALMENGATPGGHLEVPGDMKEPDKDQLVANWEKRHKGPRKAGKTAALTGGAKWVTESFSPADAELILNRNFSIAEVARFWNLPPHKLGLLEHASFATIEESNIEFYQGSIYPWLVNIEQEFNLKIFSPQERRDYCVKHNVDSILRANLQAQTERDKSLFAVGAWSINDIRLAHGMNPLDDPGADKHWLPVNNVQAIEDMDATPPEPVDDTPPEAEEDDPTETSPDA